MATGESPSKSTNSIGLGYVFTSSYFILNLLSALIYPALRMNGLKYKALSITDHWVSFLVLSNQVVNRKR